MKRTALALATLALTSAWPLAQAHEMTYDVTLTFYEPQTQPRNSIFKGSFVFDEDTGEVSMLKGKLSESMTGTNENNMTWLDLNFQLSSMYDPVLKGTLVTTFFNNDVKTFYGGVWKPEDGIAVGAIYYDWPKANAGNAYAMIFVPDDDPTKPLTQAQLDKVAYADCQPGGMMAAACMTGTSIAGYGSVGSMDGVPLSQTITVAVPEPQTYAMLLAGLGLVGAVARRRRTAV